MYRERTVSLRGLARQLNLSTATVSRALSAHPGVSAGTRQKVVDLANKLGYRPDQQLSRFFKTVRRRSNLTVVFLVDSAIYGQITTSHSFYARIQWAVQMALRAQGWHMILANAATDVMVDGNLYAVAEGMADGVIAEVRDAVMMKRLAAHAPVVLLNVELPGTNVDVVLPDAERAAREQIDRLIHLGHRRIACFRPHPPPERLSVYHWQDRRFWREYEEYGAQRGLERFAEYLRPIEFESGKHEAAIAAFLDRVLRPDIAPTAILTHDLYAIELIRQLRLRGLAVPRDISLLGYDDDTHELSCPIPLTTFRQNFDAMARTAVELLQARLKDPQRPARVVAVAGGMIERGSTAPVQAGHAIEFSEKSPLKTSDRKNTLLALKG